MLPAGTPLPDWLTWLETLSPNEIDLGLDRVHAVMARLPLEFPDHVLVIAGTNGKGSSVAIATALLQAAGYETGAYTSPHIIDYNERIAIGGRLASDDEIVAAFEAIEAVRDGVPLTYFEYGTLAAFVLFSKANLDVWVLEVGMGGRLDAVNAVDPTAALITNVALDHCDWLGNDMETIAAEKAGVMRKDIPVVFGGSDLPEAIADNAETVGARLLLPGRDFDADGLPQPGLRGDFQVQNAAAVIALLEAAGLSNATDAELVGEVLPRVQLNGRSQRVVANGTQWYLDVAHNPAAAAMLAATLGESQRDGETIAIIGMLDDKDVEGVTAPLDEYISRWIAVAADSHRAIPAAELARRIANHNNRPCLVAGSLSEALEIAGQWTGENDTILVTGSFYLVGPVLQQLELYSRPET
ncbi:MAG: folylpolyglutamate synthase/dihydrofolate synthase family protein [Woeseiaceae bacterium]|nr:folylpolyglutamate synthase/dihydrofolate synthase family protein [Woeseiaceae bacterium]